MPVLRPTLALLTAAAAGGVVSLVAGPVAPALASKPGDSTRFDTWIGYEIGRALSLVAAGDVTGDGAVDVIWGREDSDPLSLTVNIGEGSLAPARTLPGQNVATDLLLGDVDNDSDLDVVSVSGGFASQNTEFEVLLNDGSGGFTRTVGQGGVGPDAVEAADLDGDGNLDLVMANTNQYVPSDPGTGSVSVLLGNGDGTFAPETQYDTGGAQTSSVALGDMDGDEITDIVAVRPDGDTNTYRLPVLLGQGDGTFVDAGPDQSIALRTNGGVRTAMITSGDVDGDGDTDLAMGGVAAFDDAVLFNNGSAVFSPTFYEVFGVLHPRLLDLDDDGDLDLAGVRGGGGTAGDVTVQRNNGSGVLGAPELSVTSRNPLDFDIADLDGDGRVDLMVANRDTGSGATHLQRPDGLFAGPPTGNVFTPAVDVATGDLDGDGDVDVAATGVDGAQPVVRLLANDGTGALSGAGQVAYTGPNGSDARGVETGDLNGDGSLDLAWVVGTWEQTLVAYALNNGDGTFAAPAAFDMATCAGAVTLGDVDGDADLDFLMGDIGDCGGPAEWEAIAVALNDGDAGFTAGPLIPAVWRTADVVVVDVDGDDVLDVVGAGSGAGFGTGDVSIALGGGDGTFELDSYVEAGPSLRQLVTSDLDGDGDADLAALTFEESTSVMLNDGTAEFTTTEIAGEQIPGYRNAIGIAAGDVDGDTIVDLLVANETGSNIGVHTGFGDGEFQPAQTRYGARPRITDVEVADLDGDGLLDIVSPASLPGGFAAEDGSSAGAATAGETSEVARAGAGGVSVLLSEPPVCTIVGTPGADRLVGTAGTDVICGAGGDDVLVGRGGGDILLGGNGDDRIKAGSGIDVVDGGGGSDALLGGLQSDTLRGSGDRDRLDGGAGADVVDGLDGSRRNDRIIGGDGRDHCRGDKGDQLTC